jgi:hypothetical protein
MEEKKRGRKKKDEKIIKQPSEPVEKKKRGRKKKWEVETSKNILNTDNGSEDIISFHKNEKKDNTLPDSYHSKNISFGNLNITIHTNPDTINTAEYKKSLSKIPEVKNEECKIIYSDTEEDYITENLSNKLHVVDNSNKMKVMKYFEDSYSSGKEISSSIFRCMNCHHNFYNKPFFLPYEYDTRLKRYKITGNFCSPNCVKSYAMDSKIFSNKIHLVGQMYRTLFSNDYNIKCAPPINTLKCYGGKLSIEEYRSNFLDNKIYSLKNINCKIEHIEITEKINNL